MVATNLHARTIASTFDNLRPSRKKALEDNFGKLSPKVITMGHLYYETYINLKRLADEENIGGWDYFTFERIAVEYIPMLVDYFVETHQPYGATDNSIITLFTRTYMSGISKCGCISIWFNAQSTVWSLLGLSRKRPQRLIYRYDRDLLYYYVIAYVECEDEVSN